MKKIGELWIKLSIRTKLLSYFFTVILLVSLFNVYLNINNNQIMDQFNETMSTYYTINDLLVLTQKNKVAIENYIRDLDPKEKAKYIDTKIEINKRIEKIRGKSESKDIYFLLRAIENSKNAYFSLWRSAIYERENFVDGYYVDLYKGETIESYTESYIRDLLYFSLEEGNELYNHLSEEAELTKSISMILIIGVTIFAMIIGVLFSNALVKPIKKLASASIRIASGDLNVKAIEFTSEDEIGILTDSFNVMSKNIKSYVSELEQTVLIEKKLHEEELEVIRMEKLVNEAQFKALQSQINPHFLFNTLNTISRIAMFEEAEGTMKLIQSLSSLFRYKLRSGSDLIRIEEEVNISNEYVYLQQMRFKERLDYEVIVDEESKDVMIPIFSLQPIVENAIIHGIEPKVEGGKVTIEIRTKKVNEGRETEIRISDSGLGIEEKRLEQVREFEVNNNSIGLGNVFHRLKLTYRKETECKINSKQDCGTVVEFSFRREDSDG